MTLLHPQFDPIAIHITTTAGIRWYGLMYLLGFLAFFVLGRWQIKNRTWFGFTPILLDDLLFYGSLGVVLGGRFGYVLFYQGAYFIEHPLEIFAIWQGGMSFHGGFLGVVISMCFVTKTHKIAWLKLMDFIAPLVPIGLGLGRIGNFINGELWGRVTDSRFGMIFSQVDINPRHPSQLYEALLEGLILFIILWMFSRKSRPIGSVSSLFLIGYGASRFLVEFTRAPDAHLGILSFGLSMGQLLSLPMIMAGIILWFVVQKQESFLRQTS